MDGLDGLDGWMNGWTGWMDGRDGWMDYADVSLGTLAYGMELYSRLWS
jgi:hypothetical protein